MLLYIIIDQPAIIFQRLVEISAIFSSEWTNEVSNLPEKRKNVDQAIVDYVNGYKGCSFARAINFNSEAVIDDGTCILADFLGIYSVDSCNKKFVHNLFTNGLICPENSTIHKIGMAKISTSPNCIPIS